MELGKYYIRLFFPPENWLCNIHRHVTTIATDPKCSKPPDDFGLAARHSNYVHHASDG